jgi:hypothetical protein
MRGLAGVFADSERYVQTVADRRTVDGMWSPRKLLGRLVRVPAGLAPRRSRLLKVTRVSEPPWTDPPDEGGTPVREPRRPQPQPVSGAGANPIPED